MRCNITANVPFEGDHEAVQLDIEHGSHSSVCVYDKFVRLSVPHVSDNKVTTHTEHLMPAWNERCGWSHHPLPTGSRRLSCPSRSLRLRQQAELP